MSDYHLLPRFRQPDPLRAKSPAPSPMSSKPQTATPAGGDHIRLRGIPCIANGVGGAQNGTRPDRAVLRLDKR